MVAPSCLKPSKVARKKPTPFSQLVGFGIHGSKITSDFVVFGTIHESSRFVNPTISTEVRDCTTTSAGKKHENSALFTFGLFLESCEHVCIIYCILLIFALCLHIFWRGKLWMGCVFWRPNLTRRQEDLDRHSSARFQSLEISRWQEHQTSSPWAGAAALELVLSYSGLPKRHPKAQKTENFITSSSHNNNHPNIQ